MMGECRLNNQCKQTRDVLSECRVNPSYLSRVLVKQDRTVLVCIEFIRVLETEFFRKVVDEFGFLSGIRLRRPDKS